MSISLWQHAKLKFEHLCGRWRLLCCGRRQWKVWKTDQVIYIGSIDPHWMNLVCFETSRLNQIKHLTLHLLSFIIFWNLSMPFSSLQVPKFKTELIFVHCIEKTTAAKYNVYIVMRNVYIQQPCITDVIWRA